MGILLALLLGASNPCADGKCPTAPPAVVCEGGQCNVKSAPSCGSCCGKKVVAAAKSVRKCVRSRCRIFRRRK